MQSSNAVTNFQSMTASHNVNSVLSLISFDYSTPVFPQSNTNTKQNACKMFLAVLLIIGKKSQNNLIPSIDEEIQCGYLH